MRRQCRLLEKILPTRTPGRHKAPLAEQFNCLSVLKPVGLLVLSASRCLLVPDTLYQSPSRLVHLPTQNRDKSGKKLDWTNKARALGRGEDGIYATITSAPGAAWLSIVDVYKGLPTNIETFKQCRFIVGPQS